MPKFIFAKTLAKHISEQTNQALNFVPKISARACQVAPLDPKKMVQIGLGRGAHSFYM
jgi:hypothetical protein